VLFSHHRRHSKAKFRWKGKNLSSTRDQDGQFSGTVESFCSSHEYPIWVIEKVHCHEPILACSSQNMRVYLIPIYVFTAVVELILKCRRQARVRLLRACNIPYTNPSVRRTRCKITLLLPIPIQPEPLRRMTIQPNYWVIELIAAGFGKVVYIEIWVSSRAFCCNKRRFGWVASRSKHIWVLRYSMLHFNLFCTKLCCWFIRRSFHRIDHGLTKW